MSELTRTYAKGYFQWIAIGVPFYMFGQSINPIIRSDGSPRAAMAAILAVLMPMLFANLFGPETASTVCCRPCRQRQR